MSRLYPHVHPMHADAPDWMYLRRLSEIRSPHLLVIGIVSHAHAWELAMALGSDAGARHHAALIYEFSNRVALLTGKIQTDSDPS